MMSKLLANGTAVVTRAGSSTALDFQEISEDISDLTVTGLGRAIAIAFARDGCSNLALGDLSLAELEETQKTLQGQFNFLKIEVKTVDLNDETSTAEFFQLIVNRFGKIDFVVNIASYEPPVAAVHEIEESDFDQAFTANQRSVRSSRFLRTLIPNQPNVDISVLQVRFGAYDQARHT
jgi:NAD(P)-dependent dehydrogenase (short-subunit alcohol dehydrogenase family)